MLRLSHAHARGARWPLMTLALLWLALTGGCEQKEAEGPVLRAVTVAEVTRDEAVDRLVVFGQLEGEREAQVFSQMPERIAEVLVKNGQLVTTGEPLATLDAALSTADEAQARAALDVARANLDRLTTEITRLRPLVSGNALPEAQLEGLIANQAAAQAQVAQLKAAQQASSERRARTILRAPVAGRVTGLTLREGDLLAPGVPLCTVIDTAQLVVRPRLLESDYVLVTEGMKAEVTLAADRTVKARARVVEVAPVLDRMTRTAEVRIALDPPLSEKLRAGMVAEVTVDLRVRKDVTVIPAEAVVMTPQTSGEGLAAAYVVDESGRAQRRSIEIGERYGDAQEVTSGLSLGERVVTRGQHLIRDGSEVRVVPATEEPAVIRSTAASEVKAASQQIVPSSEEGATSAKPSADSRRASNQESGK